MIDAAVKVEREHADFYLRRMTKPMRSRMLIGGENLNVELLRTDAGMKIQVREQNDPEAVERSKVGIRPDAQVTIKFQFKYTPRKAELGLLKPAYIGAFAKFGYQYIMQQSLDLVRQQIREPDKDYIGQIRGWSHGDELPDTALALFTFHDPIKCVAAKIGDSLILLPWLDDREGEFWKWRTEVNLNHATVEMGRGKIWEWPTGMEMKMDFTENLTGVK